MPRQANLSMERSEVAAYENKRRSLSVHQFENVQTNIAPNRNSSCCGLAPIKYHGQCECTFTANLPFRSCEFRKQLLLCRGRSQWFGRSPELRGSGDDPGCEPTCLRLPLVLGQRRPQQQYVGS